MQVQLADQLYRQAQERASQAGFETVDEYVATIVSQDLCDDDIDHLFTPERLAIIDKAAADVQAGKFYTDEQADIELGKRRSEWLRNNVR